MSDLAKKPSDDLRKELKEQREHLREFRFGVAGSRVRNIRDGRDTRRQIARILTELCRKQAMKKHE